MGAPILDYSVSNTSRGFWCGFLVGLVAAVLLNLLPYLFTYHAYYTDGYEDLGFPFPFRRVGGYPYFYVFDAWSLVGDVLIAVGAAGVVGVAAHSRRNHGRWP